MDERGQGGAADEAAGEGGDVRALLYTIPCPTWLSAALDAHNRRRRLVLDIWALSDKGTAFFALWVARLAAVTTPHMSVEDGLRIFKGLLLK